jgi:hypothetical protein
MKLSMHCNTLAQSNVKVRETRVFARNFLQHAFTCKIFFNSPSAMHHHASYVKYFHFLSVIAKHQYMHGVAFYVYMRANTKFKIF